MTVSDASSTQASRLADPSRLSRIVRRDALLDAAVELITADGVEHVSMETIAEWAGVSRPLVYKHFANRDELLAAVYRREAAAVHAELASQVTAAGTLDEMYRALVEGMLRASAERGHVFTALRFAGAWNRELRKEQRSRDRDTIRAFAARAVKEYQLGRQEATVASAVALGALDSVLSQWRHQPTPDNARLLAAIYLRMVRAAYAAVAAAAPAPPGG